MFHLQYIHILWFENLVHHHHYYYNDDHHHHSVMMMIPYVKMMIIFPSWIIIIIIIMIIVEKEKKNICTNANHFGEKKERKRDIRRDWIYKETGLFSLNNFMSIYLARERKKIYIDQIGNKKKERKRGERIFLKKNIIIIII